VNPRRLPVNELIKILIDEHEQSRYRLSEFEKLLNICNYEAARELINRLELTYEQHIIDEEAVLLREAIRLLGRENCKDIIEIFQQHRPIITMIQQIINSVNNLQLRRIEDVLQDLGKILDIHYRREEVEVFPRILKLHQEDKS